MLTMGCTNDDIKYQLEYAESNKLFDTWKETTYVVKNTHDPHVALFSKSSRSWGSCTCCRRKSSI